MVDGTRRMRKTKGKDAARKQESKKELRSGLGTTKTGNPINMEKHKIRQKEKYRKRKYNRPNQTIPHFGKDKNDFGIQVTTKSISAKTRTRTDYWDLEVNRTRAIARNGQGREAKVEHQAKQRTV